MKTTQTIHFTCANCGAVYSSVRSACPTEKVYRLFCPGCRCLLHEGSGYYGLSELVTVLPSVIQPAKTR